MHLRLNLDHLRLNLDHRRQNLDYLTLFLDHPRIQEDLRQSDLRIVKFKPRALQDGGLT